MDTTFRMTSTTLTSNNRSSDDISTLHDQQQLQQSTTQSVPGTWPFDDGRQSLDPITAHYRMRLYDDEYDWALDIKHAIENDPSIDNLTDFQYAQLAIIDADDIDLALARARKMQQFKQEYDVRDSFECGKRNMQDFIDLLPGHWLSLSCNQIGECVLAADMSKLTVESLRASTKSLDRWLGGTYFMCHVLNPDFYSIRHGFTVLAETEGYDWKKNFGLSVHRKLWDELASVYPLQVSKAKHYNTGPIYNMLVTLSKRFVPEEIHSKFEVGCTCEMGRLDRLFATPTPQAANERLQSRFQASLQRRFQNEANFRLKPREY